MRKFKDLEVKYVEAILKGNPLNKILTKEEKRSIFYSNFSKYKALFRSITNVAILLCIYFTMIDEDEE